MIRKNIKIFILINIIQILLFSGIAFSASENPIDSRRETDAEQTKREAELLEKLQREDEKVCKAQNSGYSNPTGGSGRGLPNISDPRQNPTNNGTYGEPVGGEEDTREAIEAQGVTINKGPCNGRDYRQVEGGCTDVQGLPQHSIDRLGELNQAAGGNLLLTGGTEGGHSAHGAGKNVVDLTAKDPELNAYIRANTVKTWEGKDGTWHQLSNGDLFLDEQRGTPNHHWHADLRGSLGGGSTVALFKKIKTYAQNFIYKKVFFNIAIAQSLDNIIILGNTEIDLDSIAPEELFGIINSLSPEELNRDLPNLTQNQLTTIIGEDLPFDSLNHIFSNLSRESLDEIIPQIGTDIIESISNSLAYDSVENILTGLSTGELNSFLGNLGGETLNTLFNSVYNGDILDSVISNISNNTLSSIIGDLGEGALNNIFGNLGGDVLNDVLGNLGMDSINDIFSQLGGTVLNDVLGSLTEDVAEQIFSVIGEGAMANILNNALPEVLDEVLSGLPQDLLTDLFNGLSISELLGSFTDILDELPLVGDILGKIPGLGGILGGLGLGGGIPGLGGGLYVPVIEQNGQLMQLTKSTNETTKEIKDLNVQICTSLRAIKRIQSRFELKMVEDAQVKRIRDTELEKYRQAVFGENGLVKTGYTMLDDKGNPTRAALFVTNQKEYWEISGQEGVEIARNQVANSNHPLKDSILNLFDNSNPFTLDSTIKEADFESLGLSAVAKKDGINNDDLITRRKIPILSSLSKPIKRIAYFITGNTALAEEEPTTNKNSDDYWQSWLKLIEPKNNIMGSYAIALDRMGIEKNKAESAAREEAAQGQGFLPIRECVEKSSDGKTCLGWGTTQPGTIIREVAAKTLNSRLDVYVDAKEMGDIGSGNEPNIEEVIRNNPTPNGGGAVGPGMTSAGGITSNSRDMESDERTNTPGDTGGGNGEEDVEDSNNWIDILGRLSNFFNTNDNLDTANLDWLKELITILKRTFRAVWNKLKPLTIFDYKNKDDYTLIYWFSPNATKCIASNDWLDTGGQGPENGSSLGSKTIVDSTGALIGNLKINPPEGRTEYKMRCSNGNGDSRLRIITIDK